MENAQLIHALDELREKHIRITPQRRLVLQYLIEKRNHPTVEMIFSDINQDEPNLSLATVYNTLKMFVDEGLVIELSNGEDSIHYDYFGSPHFHVICTNCGKIIDVEDPYYIEAMQKLDEIARQKTGFKILENHLEISAICEDCQKVAHN